MLERIARRLHRFVRLDHTVYKEIAADDRATREAAAVALAAATLSALGGFTLFRGSPTEFLVRLASGFLLNWLLWSGVTQFLGRVVYHSGAPLARVMRVLGYAVAPMALGLLGFIDCLGIGLRLAGWALSLFYGFHAVREVMDLRTEAAVLTVTIGAFMVLALNVAAQLLL